MAPVGDSWKYGTEGVKAFNIPCMGTIEEFCLQSYMLGTTIVIFFVWPLYVNAKSVGSLLSRKQC